MTEIRNMSFLTIEMPRGNGSKLTTLGARNPMELSRKHMSTTTPVALKQQQWIHLSKCCSPVYR